MRDVGEYAVRGGILDLFAPGAAEPLRLDFFGDTLESIRAFDAATGKVRATVQETGAAQEILASRDTYDLIVERGEQDKASEIGRFPRLFRGKESIPGLTWQDLDPEATPACVNSCIADAMAFGDIDDPESNVSQLLAKNEHFRMHEEVGTGPGFYYLWDKKAAT